MNPPSIPTTNSVVPVSNEDKTVAILSYITLIGFIVAIVMHGSKKTQLGAFHLRQTFGLMLTGIALMIVGTVLAFIPFIGWIMSLALWFVWIGLFVLWIMGLIAAASGQLKPLPVLGKKYEEWFGGMFN
jgi:uncharacterized membrane protein